MSLDLQVWVRRTLDQQQQQGVGVFQTQISLSATWTTTRADQCDANRASAI